MTKNDAKTRPHAALNPGLQRVNLTLYRYTNGVRGILRSSAAYIKSEQLFLSVG